MLLQLTRWYHLCSDYSQHNLTDPLDRLPAMSCMAKDFRESCPVLGDYLAGLWSTHLPHQLLWRTDRPRQHRLNKYKAPSWSWASIEDEIHLPNLRLFTS